MFNINLRDDYKTYTGQHLVCINDVEITDIRDLLDFISIKIHSHATIAVYSKPYTFQFTIKSSAVLYMQGMCMFWWKQKPAIVKKHSVNMKAINLCICDIYSVLFRFVSER